MFSGTEQSNMKFKQGNWRCNVPMLSSGIIQILHTTIEFRKNSVFVEIEQWTDQDITSLEALSHHSLYSFEDQSIYSIKDQSVYSIEDQSIQAYK